ncbi:MAG: hypothetical protein ACRDTQ_02845 [Micromonosporaceae bacterium]
MAQQDLLLGAGARVLHIGPHKTGTTAIQGAFNSSRERLAEAGVLYGAARGERQPIRAALSLTGRPQMLGEAPPGRKHWNRLVNQVTGAGDKRVVVSSEFFCEADEEIARTIVDGFGGSPPVHVVVTLRPLAKIVPSQWQQYVQNGFRTPYEDWLNTTFKERKPTALFWRRHDQAKQVAKWAAVAGPENVTVIVLDESDPQMLLRTFESMVGLPDGFLVQDGGQENRSLTYGETELLRRFNLEFKSQPWSETLYAKYVRRGAVLRMKTQRKPDPAEAKIITPDWALDQAAEIGADAVRQISSLGVRVVGDISSLGVRPASRGASDEDPVEPLTAAAAHAVIGAIIASGDTYPPDQAVVDRRVRYVDSKSLLKVVLGRVWRKVESTLRAPFRKKKASKSAK